MQIDGMDDYMKELTAQIFFGTFHSVFKLHHITSNEARIHLVQQFCINKGYGNPKIDLEEKKSDCKKLSLFRSNEINLWNT